MKATLEFTLPEEQSEFDAARTGADWATVVWNLDQELRRKIKYSSAALTVEEMNAYEDIIEFIHEQIDSKGLTYE